MVFRRACVSKLAAVHAYGGTIFLRCSNHERVAIQSDRPPKLIRRPSVRCLDVYRLRRRILRERQAVSTRAARSQPNGPEQDGDQGDTTTEEFQTGFSLQRFLPSGIARKPYRPKAYSAPASW